MRVNIGCDIFKIPGLVNIDIRFSVSPNLVMDITKLALKKHCATEINLGNIIEHLYQEDLTAALNECRRILMDTGVIYITLPLVDLAEDCFNAGIIDEVTLDHIITGNNDQFNSHKAQYRMGDIEEVMLKNGFRTEPLDLWHFPYMIVSNIHDPKPDPWQYGIKAFKL